MSQDYDNFVERMGSFELDLDYDIKSELIHPLADVKWNEVSELYKKTGMNKVSRILNNIKHTQTLDGIKNHGKLVNKSLQQKKNKRSPT